MRVATLPLVVLMTLLALTGCVNPPEQTATDTGATPGPQAGDRPIRIGFSMDTLKEERWQRDKMLVEQRARELGAVLDVQVANGDDAVQTKQADNMLTKGVDVLIVAPHNGVIAAPREVLGAVPGVELREMDNRGRQTFCCGAGGGRMWMEETRGTRINQARTEQVLATGAETLATACPFCMVMLRDGLQDAGRGVGSDAPVTSQDIAELLASAVVPGTGRPVPPGRGLPVV